MNIAQSSIYIQFERMGLPKSLYQKAYEKITDEIFDAGDTFMFAENQDDTDDDDDEDEQDEVVEAENSNNSNIDADDNDNDDDDDEDEDIYHYNRYHLYSKVSMSAFSNCFLIDHMWTTTFPTSREDLKERKLQERVVPMIFKSTESISDNPEENIDNLWTRLWPYMNCYSFPGDEYTRWFLMDEVGLAICHSKYPNFNCCPILIQSNNVYSAISLIWPIIDIDEGEKIKRNFLPGVPNDHPLRKLRLLGFADYDKLNYAAEKTLSNYSSGDEDNNNETGNDLIQIESIEPEWNEAKNRLKNCNEMGTKLKIFCDKNDIINNDMLSSSSKIEIVDDPFDADVLYLIDHIVDENEGITIEHDKRGKFLNQFWWNGMLVSKEHLARTVQSRSTEEISWYPKTYDLNITLELKKFIKDFLGRTIDDDNIWISKKYLGRQSIDYPITNNLTCILRHLESAPRIVSKYISTPSLYHNKKFDLRYYVIIHSIEPLICYRHHLFNVRCANEVYSLDNLEKYQKHFTVMNLLNDNDMINIRGAGERLDPTMYELIEYFDNNSKLGWKSIQEKIDKLIINIFETVRNKYKYEPSHPSGKCVTPNSCWSLTEPSVAPARAMYGIDIILKENFSSIEPQLLEVQWAPDCTIAMKMIPNFWDEILSALYLDDFSNLTKLC